VQKLFAHIFLTFWAGAPDHRMCLFVQRDSCPNIFLSWRLKTSVGEGTSDQ